MSKAAVAPFPEDISAAERLKSRQLLRAHLWYVLIEPLKPKAKSRGGLIEIPESAQTIEEINITIGQVLQVGPLAYQNSTKGGLDMRRFSHEIEKPADLIGRFVMYKRHTGMNLVLKEPNGDRAKFLLLDDDAIICDVDDPSDFVFYYD
jgi:hypothetical protein